MSDTFQFVVFSLQRLLPQDFYLFPLVMFSFLILVYIVKHLFRGGQL